MKTTIYVPDDIKAALRRRADAEHRSESDIIREALAEAVAGYSSRLPRKLPVPPGPTTNYAEHVDDVLAEGFGSV
jgi:plasmid stability protein